MVDKTGITPDGWRKKFPLRQLLDKAESYLRERGVKYADEKEKDEKKKTEKNFTKVKKIRACIYKAMP